MPGQQTAQDTQEETPILLSLRPLRGTSPEPWEVRLDEDTLSLASSEGRVIMILPRGEAARHLRFGYDLFRGRFVSFVLAEGLRAHSFSCALAVLQTLLGWLPHKPVEAQAHELRLNSAALVLAGTAGLLMADIFGRGASVLLILAGTAGMIRGTRFHYGVNGLALLAAALWLLFGAPLTGIAVPLETRTATTGAGAVLLLWAIQQFSLLGPRQRLSAARKHLAQSSFEGEALVSALVRRVAKAAILAAAPLAVHAVALLAGGFSPSPAGMTTVIMLYGAPALALLGSAAVLWTRRRPAYAEARLTAQFILVIMVLYAGGWGVCLANGTPGFPEGALAEALPLVTRLYVWIPIVAGVVLLNGWFARRIDRELQREPE